MFTIDYFLKRTASKFSPREALVCAGRRISYADFDQGVTRLANTLISLGVKKGDPVALLAYNGPEFAYAVFGVQRAGAVCVPLNYRLKTQELTYILEDSESKVILYGTQFSETVNSLRGKTRLDRYICLSEEEAADKSLPAGSPPRYPQVEIEEEGPATLLYTSGTTGHPKGAVLTHKNLIWTCVSQAVEYGVSGADKVLITSPMFHTGAFFRFLTAVYLGNTICLMEQFDPVKFLEIIQEEEITFTSLVPTMFIMVDQLPENVKNSFRTTSLRKYITSGSILPVDLVRRIQKLFPQAEIRDSYGATEFNFATVLQPEDLERKLGSVGRAHVNAEVRILNEQGQEVPPGEVGEICVRGPQVMREYFQDPQGTKEAFHQGWFRTGDLGKMDAEGFLYIVDRRTDMIISGGENIYPREIEEVLYAHEKIAEAAVIGVPDPLWGEAVRAIIVPKPGAGLTEQEVIDFCVQRLAGYKKPRSVIFADSLPKNPSNKVLKRILKERYGAPSADSKRREDG